MSIQEINVTNNQKKNILKAIQDQNILIQEDNGDLVVNVAAYKKFKQALPDKSESLAPIEAIVGESLLDFSAEFFVLS